MEDPYPASFTGDVYKSVTLAYIMPHWGSETKLKSNFGSTLWGKKIKFVSGCSVVCCDSADTDILTLSSQHIYCVFFLWTDQNVDY